jgi:SAM-dependent methyltransferase
VMQRFGHLIYCAARSLRGWGGTLRCSNLCYGLLPALLLPQELISLVKRYYRERSGTLPSGRPDIPTEEQALDPWERKVLERYAISSGRMLVLGSGSGRESLRIAETGTWVVGVDAENVVRAASRARRSAGAKAVFVQADFMHPPFAPATFDYLLISNSMYSSVPGRLLRQHWLGGLRELLTDGGLLVISFIPEWHRGFGLKTICTGLSALLVKLPGANPDYQPGDEAFDGHFLHAFQSEDELRRELTGAGAVIRELNWADSYVVVTFAVTRALPSGHRCRSLVLSPSPAGANR